MKTRDTNIDRSRTILLAISLALLVQIVVGCRDSTQQVETHENVIQRGSVIGGTRYAFWQRIASKGDWKEDRKILFWLDFNYSAEVNGSSHKQRTRAYRTDGWETVWEIAYPEGESTKLAIDGTSYDLSRGSLFLIERPEGKTQVRQILTDLPDAGVESETFEAFAKTNPDIRNFIEQASKR